MRRTRPGGAAAVPNINKTRWAPKDFVLRLQGVTHWSIPVNDLDVAERFYRDVLGLEFKGRLGNSTMSCFVLADNSILLCQRRDRLKRTPDQDNHLHHAFTVAPESFDSACKVLSELKIPVEGPVYRERGFFTGRELYFPDPSGNLLELRDPAWRTGMPKPAYAEIVRSG